MKEEAEAPEYLRVYVQGGGCSGLSYGMGFEKAPEEDDLVMEESGVKLLVDSYSVDHLQGANVDYIESLMGSGFKINNPNVTKSVFQSRFLRYPLISNIKTENMIIKEMNNLCLNQELSNIMLNFPMKLMGSLKEQI
jgi:iron-sulfur cluster assembly protein